MHTHTHTKHQDRVLQSITGQMGVSLLLFLRSGALNCRLIRGGVVKPHPPCGGPTPSSMSAGGGRAPERGRLW